MLLNTWPVFIPGTKSGGQADAGDDLIQVYLHPEWVALLKRMREGRASRPSRRKLVSVSHRRRRIALALALYAADGIDLEEAIMIAGSKENRPL